MLPSEQADSKLYVEELLRLLRENMLTKELKY